jgi:hypothetical protein
MSIPQFISTMPNERQAILTALHEVIVANDPTVIAAVKPMMGKDMILYEQRCVMKYGLAGVKAHMSLHCLPMYMNPVLHTKYESLLPAAKFQKGCINFSNGVALPPGILAALIAECSAINIAEMLEKRKKKK